MIQKKTLALALAVLAATSVSSLASAWPWSTTTSVDGAAYGGWPANHADKVTLDGNGQHMVTTAPFYYLKGSFSFNNVPVNKSYTLTIHYISGGSKTFNINVGKPYASSWDVGNLGTP